MVEESQEKVVLSEEAQKVLDLVGELSILDLSRLVKAMEEKFEISPVAVGVSPAMVAGEGGGAAAEEEKSNYDVVLQSVGEKKIAVIKVVRSINQNLGLKEAKELVEGAPKTVAEVLPVEEAEQAKKALEEAGAVVELK